MYQTIKISFFFLLVTNCFIALYFQNKLIYTSCIIVTVVAAAFFGSGKAMRKNWNQINLKHWSLRIKIFHTENLWLTREGWGDNRGRCRGNAEESAKGESCERGELRKGRVAKGESRERGESRRDANKKYCVFDSLTNWKKKFLLLF